MRAIYIEEDLVVGEKFHLKGEKVHHLNNVLRVKTGEEVLVINGRGQAFKTQIFEIKKREVILECFSEQVKKERTYSIDIGVAQVKKEAMDQILKSACELGVGHISILETTHSQRYKINEERMNKHLISAIEQSNNYILPSVDFLALTEIDFSKYDNIYLFSTREVKGDIKEKLTSNEKNLILIGPEAGFSTQELIQLEKLSQIKLINLPTPILRAPTAMNCAVGYLLSRYSRES